MSAKNEEESDDISVDYSDNENEAEPEKQEFIFNPLINGNNPERRLAVSSANAPNERHDMENTAVPKGMRSVSEIPERYRNVFSDYPYFNAVQSQVMDDLLYSDNPVVVAAPTGSGKTVLFELAIVRLLHCIHQKNYTGDFKIVYMAPVKALCSERFHDWREKFECHGLPCTEVTGDSETSDYFHLRHFRLVFTTPEKWDSLTRKWRDNKSLVQVVKLFLIDEVHLLNDEKRGPTMEAVVSRMKTVQSALELEMRHQPKSCYAELLHGIRFVAVSATVPNLEDVAEWLSAGGKLQATAHKISEDMRPVKLNKVVIGYSCQENWSPFRFDISLTYRLHSVILKYSEGKPSLVFCSTRKGVTQTASMLIRNITIHFKEEEKGNLLVAVQAIKDPKVRESVLRGVGFHHAGMDQGDRRAVEELFRSASLPVLVATSTLAMGVNLPAHLVVIKSTEQYIGGMYSEYPESQLLQMMGRAGRPQFDTSATAVIMTKNSFKAKYERLMDGKQMVESSLHRHLPEHLNAEVVLHTITDVSVAMEWVRSTFLYVRAVRNPHGYGLAGQEKSEDITRSKIETRLHELCMRELNALSSLKLVEIVDGMDVTPTEIGRLMARYYVALDTMRTFMELKGEETLPELLTAVSRCAEFSELQLRMNERKTLNYLNRGRGHETIRYPMAGRIKSREMKVNCLVQAVLGSLPMPDASLNQDMAKVIRIGQRVTKCLAEFVAVRRPRDYRAQLFAVLLGKCFACRLWGDSIYVARQLERIGPALAAQLAHAGKTSFDAIQDSNPRDLERILNRAPPLGNNLQDAVAHLPKYTLKLEVSEVHSGLAKVTLELELENTAALEVRATAGERHSVVLMLAERCSNHLIHRERLADSYLMGGTFVYSTGVQQESQEGMQIVAHVISEQWAGFDVEHIVNVSSGLKPHLEQPSPSMISTAPRNFKAALKKFVRKQVKKLGDARSEATNSGGECGLELAGRDKQGSSTPGHTAPAPLTTPTTTTSANNKRASTTNTSLVKQIHSKYGLLPSLPVKRLRPLPPTLSHDDDDDDKCELAMEADFSPAQLPKSPAKESLKPASHPPLHSSAPDILSTINFDLGVEQLLAEDDSDVPIITARPSSRPRETRDIIETPRRAKASRAMRHLSPPKERALLAELVRSVLGEVPAYVGSPSSSPDLPRVEAVTPSTINSCGYIPNYMYKSSPIELPTPHRNCISPIKSPEPHKYLIPPVGPAVSHEYQIPPSCPFESQMYQTTFYNNDIPISTAEFHQTSSFYGPSTSYTSAIDSPAPNDYKIPASRCFAKNHTYQTSHPPISMNFQPSSSADPSDPQRYHAESISHSASHVHQSTLNIHDASREWLSDTDELCLDNIYPYEDQTGNPLVLERLSPRSFLDATLHAPSPSNNYTEQLQQQSNMF